MTSRRLAATGLIVSMIVFGQGCLNSSTLIKLRADGSGTIEQTLLVNPKSFEGLAAMAEQMSGGEAKAGPSGLPSPKELLDEAKLKEAAAKFGRGVRYVSSTPLKQGDLEGARAVFAFDDINALTVDQSPQGSSRDREPVTFRFQRGAAGSVLTVTLPDRDKSDEPTRGTQKAGPTAQMPPEALALVRPFFEGMRVAIALDIDGKIVKTNADHVSGSRVTLLDIDFTELLKNPAAFEKLGALGPGASISDVQTATRDMPGLKVNASPSVRVEFK
jgi:hypothetical protein